MTKKNKKTILIKPHHFLDIIKLFGSGLNKFVPDVKFGHDFWKVGNEILENPNIELELTIDNDDICIPCKFSNGKICTDVTSTEEKEEMSKDEWNKIIDLRLLKILNLEVGNKLTAIEFCKLAKEKINRENIFEVWKEKSKMLSTKIKTNVPAKTLPRMDNIQAFIGSIS